MSNVCNIERNRFHVLTNAHGYWLCKVLEALLIKGTIKAFSITGLLAFVEFKAKAFGVGV
jgi:hypothetical protein